MGGSARTGFRLGSQFSNGPLEVTPAAFLSSKPKPIEPRVKAPLVAIVAEGNLVVLSFVSKHKDPKDATKIYTTTWFDMFRVEGGKIAEHWDPDTKE